MRPCRRTLISTIAVTALSAVFAVAVWLTASSHGSGAETLGTITRAEYSRQKAVPGFDRSRHVVNDRTRLDELAAVLRDARWIPGEESWDDAGCAGGTRTTMTIALADGSSRRYDGCSCGDRSPAVVGSVDAVIDRW